MIEQMTHNDYEILASILDKDDVDKGIIATKGTTISEIIKKTELSRTKVGQSLSLFLKDGLIEYGLSVRNAKSFILTDNGIKKIFEMRGEL